MVPEQQRRRWDDGWPGELLLSPEELQGCLEQALAQSARTGTPIAVLVAYRADLKLSPAPSSEPLAAAAVAIHNLTRPSDYVGVTDNLILAILPNTTASGAWIVAERITASLRAREATKPWRITPVTHAEQFGTAARLLQAIRKLTSEFAA
jgi:hypothetical protein